MFGLKVYCYDCIAINNLFKIALRAVLCHIFFASSCSASISCHLSAFFLFGLDRNFLSLLRIPEDNLLLLFVHLSSLSYLSLTNQSAEKCSIQK